MTLLVRTVRDATSDNPPDVVVPKGQVGEVCGGGEEEGRSFYAIDFGHVFCDLYDEDVEEVTAS